MTIRNIIRMGHPTLRKIADPYPVDLIGSEEFNALLTDLKETLAASGGIGLAAPQINRSVQVAVIEIAEVESRYGQSISMPFSVFINPRIEILNRQEQGYWEGCLSVPGLRGKVYRPEHIAVHYLDLNADAQQIELRGFLATVFQHEFDHLQGKLYLDHITDTTQLSFEAEFLEFELDQQDQAREARSVENK